MSSKKKNVAEEIEKEQAAFNVSDEEKGRADEIEMSDDERHDVEKELNMKGHAKSSGFETPHAKQFQQSPYQPSGLNDPFLMPRKDSSRVYKQISFMDFKNGGYRDIRGWIPLTKANATVEPFPNPEAEYGVAGIQLDGFWHIGDRIWAFMPRERYAKMRQQIRLRTQARTGKITKEFEREGQSMKKNLIIEDESYGAI